jgi:hypothetical protein
MVYNYRFTILGRRKRPKETAQELEAKFNALNQMIEDLGETKLNNQLQQCL